MSKETTEFPEGSIQKEAKGSNKKKILFWSLLASGVGVIIIVALLLIFLLPKEEKYEIELSSNVSVEDEILTGNGSYKKGESITIVAEEITGYRFTGWSFNGNIISTDKEYTFIIGEDTEGEYTANYDKLYSISVEDVHNSVSIEGNKTQAIEDEKVEFAITQNPDYRLISVKVNEDILTENDGKYTFEMPAEDVTISVTYAEEYAITINSNSSEYVQIEKQNAIAGENVEFTVSEKVGYRVVEVKYNETTLQSDSNTYTFNMPAENVTISVTYAEEYAITIDSSVSDMVTSVSIDKAISGEQVVVTANIQDTVTEDYVIMSDGLYYIENGSEEKVTINKTEGKYSFTMPANDITIGVEKYRRLDDFTFEGNAITGYTGSDTELILPSYYETVNINSQNYTIEKETGIEITEIGRNAFSDCNNLTSVIIPDGVTLINDIAFQSCDSLQTVEFGDNSELQRISTAAFRDCYNLTSITIPEGVTSLGDSWIFDNCYSLAIVYNNSSLDIKAGSPDNGNVGRYAYEILKPGEEAKGRIEEINNMRYYINDTTQTKVALWMLDRTASSVSLEEDTTAVGFGTFRYCRNLTSITIPASVTSIGYSAFEGCRNLTSITIPSNVTSIAWYAFSNCYSLAIVYNNSSLDITAGSYINGYVGYYAYEVLKLGEKAQGRIEEIDNVSYYINGTTKVALSVIDRSVSSVSLEEDTTAINQYAFQNCTSLSSITIPAGVTTLDNSTFSGCTSLQTIDFGDNSQIQTIGNETFRDCTNLTSITIPASVTSISNNAFQNCYSLAIVYNNSSLDITAGSSSNGNVGEYAYEVVKPGEEAKGKIEEINNVRYYINDSTQTKVALYVIDRKASSVSLEEDTTTINQYAFDGCTNLTSITIPSSVTSIGSSAFEGCTNLTSITIPASVTSIGNYAFNGCSNLTSVTIESDDIYNRVIGTDGWSHAGGLLANATTVKVLKTIVDGEGNVNDYLNNESNFTKTTQGADDLYYTYTKINNI